MFDLFFTGSTSRSFSGMLCSLDLALVEASQVLEPHGRVEDNFFGLGLLNLSFLRGRRCHSIAPEKPGNTIAFDVGVLNITTKSSAPDAFPGANTANIGSCMCMPRSIYGYPGQH